MIPIDMLPSFPMQSATSPVALLEKFGPHELETDARRLSAKEPVEQAPSVIAEPPVAVAAYALGIICCPAAIVAAAAPASAIAATTRVLIKIIFFVSVLSVFFIIPLKKNCK